MVYFPQQGHLDEEGSTLPYDYMDNATRRQESKRWEVLQVVAYGQPRERQMKNKSLHHFYDCAWASLYGKEYGKLGRWTQSVQVNIVRVGGSGNNLFSHSFSHYTKSNCVESMCCQLPLRNCFSET